MSATHWNCCYISARLVRYDDVYDTEGEPGWLMNNDQAKSRRDIDRDLDQLEAKIAELRIQYEQYFVDVLPQPPDQLHAEVVRSIKSLLKAPFKNSATRFRLRTLIQRYQTYNTYWEKVKKQREEGTYFRDIFKAEMREKMTEEDAKYNSSNSTADRGMRQLFDSYQAALNKVGTATNQLNFDTFKKSLIGKAKELKQVHGVNKLSYKIVVKDGKVTVKAEAKK